MPMNSLVKYFGLLCILKINYGLKFISFKIFLMELRLWTNVNIFKVMVRSPHLTLNPGVFQVFNVVY